MSKKFHAVNKMTKERWTPPPHLHGEKVYLVMYDSGNLAVVSEDCSYQSIDPMNMSVWEAVYHDNKH